MQKITSIAPFIEQGLHTVPLNGAEIARNEAGKKQGFNFPKNWQDKYSKEQNDTHTPIGGLLTGELGDKHLVAIDCDDSYTYELFKSIDPGYTAVFESIGKVNKDLSPIKSCTILYLADPSITIPPSKKLKGEHDLDWYNNTGMVFLPTAQNSTKATWYSSEAEDGSTTLYNHNQELVIIKTIPAVVAQVLNLLLNSKTAATADQKNIAETTHSRRTKGFLGKALEEYDFRALTEDQTYVPEITKLITPKEYRTDLFHKQGHIHPTDIGVRHDYLFKTMCILAGDNTVDTDLARDCIMWVNSLLDPPRSAKQMDREIIAGIISGRQHNQAGEPYWEYDENWESLRSWTAIDRTDGDLMDIFYDKTTRQYFVYNTHTDDIDVFTRKGEVIDHIQAISTHTFNQKEVIANMNNVITVVEPTHDFGYLNNDRQFNLFKPTQALRILADPSIYTAEYKEPTEFINYIEHFIPNKTQRDYLLSLLKRKLTTFDYSPVVPYIIGIPGSGKGILMSILERLMGSKYVSKEVSGGLFISNFNKGWLENKYIINLNELAEGLQNKQERVKAIGDLKIYTGADSFQCVGKGKDPYQAKQRAMFIMTANKNPLPIEDNDRRIYYIHTPNTFDSNPLCLASKSSSHVYHAILNQIEDIAYWLATEADDIADNDYTTAPTSRDKNRIIYETAEPSVKIALVVDNVDKYIEYLREDIPNALQNLKKHGRVYRIELVDMFRLLVSDSDHLTDSVIDNFIVSNVNKNKHKQDAGRVSGPTVERSFYPIDSTLISIQHDEYAEGIDLEDIRI